MKLLRQYKRNRRQYKITETQKKMLFFYKNKVLQPLTQIFFEKRQKSLTEVPFILLKKTNKAKMKNMRNKWGIH